MAYSAMMGLVAAHTGTAQTVTPPNQLDYQGKHYRLAHVVTDEKGARQIEASWPQNVTFKTLETDRYGVSVVLVYDAQNAFLQERWVQQGAALAYAVTSDEEIEKLLQQPVDVRWRAAVQQTQDMNGMYRQVRSKVHSATIQKNQAFLNSDEDWKKDFTIYIPSSTLRKMDRAMLENIKGKWVRVRGLITWHYGPSIALLNPDMMEVENVSANP